MGAVDGLDLDWLGFCRRAAEGGRVGIEPRIRRAMAPTDWLAFSRRAAEAARSALRELTTAVERAERLGRGEGGDMTLAIDRAVEDAVFAELESLGVGLCALSEERGLVAIAGGGPVCVVIDPIDGSLNAKRGLPLYSLSIAVAGGDDMAAVEFAYVADLSSGEEWWAHRGEGAWFDGERLEPGEADAQLEILGVESADPRRVAAAGGALAETEAHRLRMIGSIALSLGHGRTHAGEVGTGVGVDAYRLRVAAMPWFADGVSLAKTGRRQALAELDWRGNGLEFDRL